MVMYRDKVKLDISDRPLRANVWVVSQQQMFDRWGEYNKRVIIVSAPASFLKYMKGARTVIWRKDEYTIVDEPIGITALGRLDHWEMTATMTTAGGIIFQ